MFAETVTSKDRTTSTGTATEQRALALLRRMVKRPGCRIEVTRTGGVRIERDVWDGDVTPKLRTITLEPSKPLGNLTKTVLEALGNIDAREAYLITGAQAAFSRRNGSISAGIFGGSGPALAARLINCGLVTLGRPYEATSNGYMPETRTPVQVSLAARLALFAREHRTRTSKPIGIGRGGKRGSALYDGTSAASCTCRDWTGTFDGRMFALDAARQHRQDAAAEFLRTL